MLLLINTLLGNIYRTHAIITRSWILAIHKDRTFWKTSLKQRNGLHKWGNKNTSYNGTRAVDRSRYMDKKVFTNFSGGFLTPVSCLKVNRTITTRSLYILNPLFERQKRLLKVFFLLPRKPFACLITFLCFACVVTPLLTLP